MSPAFADCQHLSSPLNGRTYRVGDVVRFSAAGSFDRRGRRSPMRGISGMEFSSLGTVDHIYTLPTRGSTCA